MASFQHTLVKQTVKRLIQSLQIRQSDIPFVRRAGDSITAKIPIPLGTSVQNISFAKFDAEMLKPADARKDFIILYLHGGGYVLGSTKTHRAFVAKIANEAKIRAFSVNYRLAPEAPFPAALDDALDSYEWLLAQGYKAKQIFIAGDSAGGGLTLATLLALREMKKELPLAGICLSPWTDLNVTGKSTVENKHQDAMLEHFDISSWARMYYRDFEPTHPLISPLYADLQGLPPILIQVSEDEILRDDAVRFAWKANEAGVEVEMQKWKGLVHVWQLFWQYVPESKDAISQIATYIKDKMEAQTLKLKAEKIMDEMKIN